jgi:adenylosuccinate lyase
LRREGYPNPYEELKRLSRGKSAVTKKSLHEFIDGLAIREEVKNELKRISPMNYTGIIRF